MVLSAADKVLVTNIGLVIETIVACIATCASTLLLVASTQSKTLCTSCNIMIAFCALFDVAHSIGSIFEIIGVLGGGLINSFTCFCIMFVPEIGVYAGCLCVLFIGVDRLISIKFLSFYNRMDKRKYILCQLSLIFAFACYPPYLMIAYYQSGRVFCNISEVFHGEAILLWNSGMITVNLLTILPYWRYIKTRKVSTQSRRLFRSLLLVMIFEVGAWLLTSVNCRMIHTLNISDETRYAMRFLCGYSIYLGISVKTVIYYFTNLEYRKAIRRTLFLDDQNALTAKQSTSGPAHRKSSNPLY